MIKKATKSYYIQTFGCQLNFADSERIAAKLKKQGYQPAKIIENADLVVINSCIVRESAENRVYGLINNLLKSKSYNLKTNKIILTGCLAGWALRNKQANLKNLRKRIGEKVKITLIEDLADFSLQPQRQSDDWAYVPISNGCNHFCSYCIVPYARGREIYRPAKNIIKDIHCALKQGYSKIMLLGQNVNTWVNADDRVSKSSRIIANNFGELLGTVAKIEGIKEVTFMSANPRDFSDQLIKVIKKNKNICREIHLPVQSGDNKILKAMNRGYSREDYLNLVKKLKKEIPEAKITTDLLVGFPNETEKAFQNTIDLCQKINFKRAFINKYSPRPGTAAAKNLKDNIPPPIKKRRWQILEKMIND